MNVIFITPLTRSPCHGPQAFLSPAASSASPEVLSNERAARRRLQELLEGGRAAFVEELHEHHYLPGRLARRLRRLARVVRGQSRRHVGGAADVLSVRLLQAAEDVDTTSRRVVLRHEPRHCTKVAGPRVLDTGAKRVGARGGLRELRTRSGLGVAIAAILEPYGPGVYEARRLIIAGMASRRLDDPRHKRSA
jgi:hypothetical protein